MKKYPPQEVLPLKASLLKALIVVMTNFDYMIGITFLFHGVGGVQMNGVCPCQSHIPALKIARKT